MALNGNARSPKVAVYVDGGCWPNPGPAAIGAVVVSEHGEIIFDKSMALERATNNIAEYRALLLGISLARFLNAGEAHFLMDSQLVVNQVKNFWAIKDPELGRLHGEATGRLYMLPYWSIQHIPRERNAYADLLCNRILRPGDKRAKIDEPAVRYQPGDLRPGFRSMTPVAHAKEWNS